MHKRIDHLPDETLAAFQAHSWPGNVRELQNMVERAVIMSNDGELPNPLPHACPQSSRAIRLDRDPMPNTEDRFAVDLNQTGALLSQGTLRNYQKVLILQALQASGWVIGGPGGAASQLGLKRTTLIAKMRSFGISRPTPQFKLGEGIFGSNDESQEQSVAD
jgi:transcriptional regulator with GAF, ATPase, and Fis domain